MIYIVLSRIAEAEEKEREEAQHDRIHAEKIFEPLKTNGGGLHILLSWL